MPTIRVEMFEGRTLEQKRALAEALTEAAVRTLGSSRDSVDVVLTEVSRQNWSTGGVLWSDKANAAAAAPAPAASDAGSASAKPQA